MKKEIFTKEQISKIIDVAEGVVLQREWKKHWENAEKAKKEGEEQYQKEERVLDIVFWVIFTAVVSAFVWLEIMAYICQ